MTDYDYLIKQLNLLIGFLDVSDEDVYMKIKHHDRFNLGLTIEQLYETNYNNYSNHICTSALLLGFAHFEDFITKCIIKILTISPEKNKHKISYKEINSEKENLINYLACERTRGMTFVDKIKLIENEYSQLDKQLIIDVRLVNDIRNCLMHNNGIADERISSIFIKGEKIILSSGDVNNYGLKARNFATQLWAKISNY